MKIIDELLQSVSQRDCSVKRACIGLSWTVVESLYTGMAHTLKSEHCNELPGAGKFEGKSAFELAQKLRSWNFLEASLGLAALNSLIEPVGKPLNVVDDILKISQDKTLTIVGHFPFNKKFCFTAKKVHILEIEPQEGELPFFSAEEVLPESDVVIITGSSIINKSLPRILELAAGKFCAVIGPSTPMNQILFDFGVNIIAGVHVTQPDFLFSCVMQGGKSFKNLMGIEPLTRMLSEERNE